VERKDRPKTSPLETLFQRGRRLVAEAAQLPVDALRFLGTPTRARHRRPPEGAAPGEMVLPPDAAATSIKLVRYGPGRQEEQTITDVSQLRDLVSEPGLTSWIDLQGFGDHDAIEGIGQELGIHPLAMADVVHIPQRPKAELYDGRLLVVSQMARLSENGEIVVEQVSVVLGPGWVVTFQETPGDVFDPVRARIRSETTRIRQMGADFLAYALIDAVVDGFFPVIEAIGGVVEALEEEVIEGAGKSTLARIHATRRTLLTLHRVQWSQRDAIALMLRDEDFPISDGVKVYLRDAHDHAFQTLDAIETYRDMVVGLMDLYLSSTSNRLNEVMKTLTIVATIFIPLTFVTGVYGMNFEFMPELHSRWGYATVWGVMLAIAVGLVLWFRARGWIDSEGPDDSD